MNGKTLHTLYVILGVILSAIYEVPFTEDLLQP
jgi:hypothetical protein